MAKQALQHERNLCNEQSGILKQRLDKGTLSWTCTVSTVELKHWPILDAYFATHLIPLKSPMICRQAS